MRIRLIPSDTHTTPLHARGGHYTRRSGGESVIVTAARSLHLSTCGFAAREARGSQLQPALARNTVWLCLWHGFCGAQQPAPSPWHPLPSRTYSQKG